jgi:SRSO17 transposase
LKAYIIKTQELGATHFEGKESHSFGTLTSTEWNNMFYKHLDHHLGQFGV